MAENILIQSNQFVQEKECMKEKNIQKSIEIEDFLTDCLNSID
jgi:hypothetical protein